MSSPSVPNVRIWDGTNYLPTMDTAGRAGFMKVTDGTNTMPTMDVVGRAGFQKITDGTNTMPTLDVAARAGFLKVTDGTNTAAVKAASTAPIATDPALVVTLSPNGNSITVTKSATSTVTGVAASATSVTLLASNANRLGATIQNDTTSATLYVKLGATATTASGGYTVILPAGAYWEVPANHTGVIAGIWTAATGFANVDELT